MKAIKTTGDSDKKKNRKEKRSAKKAARKASRNSSSTSIYQTSNDGLKGSCEAGNLKACKTKVKKTPGFNPNKKRLAKSKIVGSAKQREREARKEEKKKIKAAKGKTTPYSSPRFL